MLLPTPQTCHTGARRVISYDMLERIGTVRRKSKSRWFIDLRPYGFGKLYSDRGEPLRTRADAQRLLNQIHGKMRKGQTLESVIDEFYPDLSKRHLVRFHAEAWLAEIEAMVETGERSGGYTRGLRSYLNPGGYFDYWDGVSIYEVTTKQIRNWPTALIAERGISARTAHKAVSMLNAVFNWLREDEELGFSPPRFVYPKFDKNPPRIITAEDQDAVLAAIPEDRRGAFIAMALLGVRPNEVIALDVTDIEGNVLRVTRARKGRRSDAPIHGVKGGQGKVLPLPALLSRWVNTWVKPYRITGPLFTNPRGRTAEKRWGTDSLEATWNTAAKSVGIQINLYNGCKHSCASEMLQRVPKHFVQALLGHADIRSVDSYGRVDTATLADVIREPQVIPLFGEKNSKQAPEESS